jgi:hypothetical protein
MKLHRSLRVFSLMIDGRPILAFAAMSSVEARMLVEQSWFNEDLRRLTERGRPVWNGRSDLVLNNASEGETRQFLLVFAETCDDGIVVHLTEMD